MDSLKEKTGFDGKKLANIVYRLKKQGLVKSPVKGMYVKA
jgi:DNA-binding IscR family transcriptional regulator